jgi:HK97 family phage major capsid protein
MPNTAELRQSRAKHVHDARTLIDRATAEGRDLNTEEQAAFDKHHADAARVKVQYERLESQEAVERELGDSAGRRTAAGAPHVLAGAGRDGPVTLNVHGQTISLAAGSPGWERCQPAYRGAFRSWLGNGHVGAALQTDVGSSGGYITTPEEFNATLIRTLNDMRWIRKLARKFVTSAQSLGTPKRTAKMASFAWGSELSTPTPDSALKFGKRALAPHYMTGEILVSRDLMRSAAINPEEIVNFEIERDSGELEEQAFLTGSGAQRPLGLFVASADGISTGRDVSAGNSTTAIGADALRNAKYALRAQYRNSPSIGWIFHRDAVKQISTLKDGNGQYLWQNGVTAGDPDRLLNYPVNESEFAPNTFTTGQYVGLLGDLSWYWIADAFDGMDMQRLIEKYAEQNQVAFICRRKVDGAPMLEEAFSRLKLA